MEVETEIDFSVNLSSFLSDQSVLNEQLSSACRDGCVEKVKDAIEKGADVNHYHVPWRSFWGNTPLMLASKNGHAEVVQILIKAGARLEAPDIYIINTPLMLASKNGHVEVVQILIKAGAQLEELTNRCGDTPLMLASKNGHAEVVQILIKAGARLEATNMLRNTPLVLASKNGHAEVVQILIKAGAQMKATDWLGNTPLMLARKNGHSEVVQILIARLEEIKQIQLLHEAALKMLLLRLEKRCLRRLRKKSKKSLPLLFISLRELVSLLKSLRAGWGPPLELVVRMVNSKFWVMEADVWADLLIVCCWANPTTTYCKTCDEDTATVTTSCNHILCRCCLFERLKRRDDCPECGQNVLVVMMGQLQSGNGAVSLKTNRKRQREEDDDDINVPTVKRECLMQPELGDSIDQAINEIASRPEIAINPRKLDQTCSQDHFVIISNYKLIKDCTELCDYLGWSKENCANMKRESYRHLLRACLYIKEEQQLVVEICKLLQ